MDQTKIIDLMTNSGLKVFGLDRDYVYFQDPSCIFPAFDTILNYAWVVILFLTGVMLFGWAILYIKNGFKAENVFNNAKTLILIFAILSLVKPIVNVVYGDNLFAKQCEVKKASLNNVNELLKMREQKFGNYDEYVLSESFEVIDSGIYWDQNYSNVVTQNINVASTPSVTKQQPSVAQTQTTNQSSFVFIEYGQGFTVYVTKTGEKVKRSGGSLAWRNNNPGNIRKSKNSTWLGAIGETDSWAVFADEESGLRAITKLLRGKNYINLSIKDAIHRWAPFSDGNNPVAYAKKVSNMTRLNADTIVKDLSDKELMNVARAIQTVEGWKIGKEEKI